MNFPMKKENVQPVSTTHKNWHPKPPPTEKTGNAKAVHKTNLANRKVEWLMGSLPPKTEIFLGPFNGGILCLGFSASLKTYQ